MIFYAAEFFCWRIIIFFLWNYIFLIFKYCLSLCASAFAFEVADTFPSKLLFSLVVVIHQAGYLNPFFCISEDSAIAQVCSFLLAHWSLPIFWTSSLSTSISLLDALGRIHKELFLEYMGFSTWSFGVANRSGRDLLVGHSWRFVGRLPVEVLKRIVGTGFL